MNDDIISNFYAGYFQEFMWKIGETIGSREGRFDACVAAAGILKNHIGCLNYPADEFREVSNFNIGTTLEN